MGEGNIYSFDAHRRERQGEPVSLYEMVGKVDDETIHKRQEYLATELERLEKELERKRISAERTYEAQGGWNNEATDAFNLETLGLAQSIENIKAELEVREPKKILGPNGEVSPLYEIGKVAWGLYQE